MIDARESQPVKLVPLAIAFELALAVLGWLVAWLGGISLWPRIWPEPQVATSLIYGLLATLPMMPVLAVMLLCQWRPIARLRRLVGRFVRQVFGQSTLVQLAGISLAAGFGEEILFRGAIQPMVVRYTSPIIGIAIASLLFGAVHAASWSYFWLATFVGAYLGVLSHWRGEILSASVAHAAYDFIALTCVARGYFLSHRPLFSTSSGSSRWSGSPGDR